jgi:hypothetical protein
MFYFEILEFVIINISIIFKKFLKIIIFINDFLTQTFSSIVQYIDFV